MHLKLDGYSGAVHALAEGAELRSLHVFRTLREGTMRVAASRRMDAQKVEATPFKSPSPAIAALGVMNDYATVKHVVTSRDL